VGQARPPLPERALFSPKGWEFSAQGNALGIMARTASSLKGWDSLSQPFRLGKTADLEPRALPWAENSQPFGLKNGSPCARTV
jgi:hypothetical protein